MANVAVLELSSSAILLPIVSVQSGLKMKRKTPSELRDEQLKRSGGTLPDRKLDPAIHCERHVLTII
ncbi:hypothetical protein AXF42_Ash021567 [Apostasia shenzhenica]|uniref:Uncharacterized protein n=1 Tax=Apostasia shenzhenica TaxID=1088818 RepID=A0A2H9ZUY5_9ASPA|nr:hypothetical protein AXF42_Ash021567 [Apostasia shenzhenica]